MLKLIENKTNKINIALKKLIENYTYVSTNYTPGDDLYNCTFTFICKLHGKFTLTGSQVRMGYSCLECKDTHTKGIIKHFNKLNQMERISLLESKFKNYTFSDEKSIELDNTIRPECKYHGQFLTTPRKLLDPDIGDTCKWCDGIEMDDDGINHYGLSRLNRFKERKLIRKQNSQINYIDNFNIVLEEDNVVSNLNIFEILSKEKEFNEYGNYLNRLRDPSNHDSIFFKINVTDKSTKFQFSIVHVIYLNDSWNAWYKKCLETMDSDNAQDYATNYIISEWFHALFYGKTESELQKKEINFEYEFSYYKWSLSERVQLLVKQYEETNSNKILKLPDIINFKIHYDLEAVGIRVYWSENQWETTATSVSLVREVILKSENKCPICNKPIKDPVVDHEHKKKLKGSGRIRDNICSTCNVFIAKTENNCKRYKIDLEELPQVLKNVSDYFSQQQYNVIHYTEKDKRPTLNKSTAAKVLKYWEVLYPNKKKPKIPRSGIMTNDWQEYVEALEAYLANPFRPLSKLTYNKLVAAILNYNDEVLERIKNEKMAKSKQPKLLVIPVYPKLKVVTQEIALLLKQFNI